MKLGSLFDGSGGFPLAATQCGISDVGKRDCLAHSAVCNAGDSGGIEL